MEQPTLQQQLLSEEMNQFISHRPHWTIGWANTIFLTLLVAVIALSWYVRYPEIISVPVRMTQSPSGEWRVELYPSSADSKKIRAGQPVTIRLQEPRGTEAGRLTGTTGHIEAPAAIDVELQPGQTPLQTAQLAATAEVTIGTKPLINNILGTMRATTH